MIRFQDYLTDRVEKAAADSGITVYQAAEWGDCGWWIFKDNNGITKAKLYYFFEEDYCCVREGKSGFYPGVKCYYGNDADEKKLVDYIQGKLSKTVSLDSVLANAKERSTSINGSNSKSFDYLVKD